MVEDWQAGGFGLYVHWPFCQAKCPYCDFNSHVSRQIDQDDWCAAYLAELDRWGQKTQGRPLVSIYFGGGTPSLMDPSTVGHILDAVARHWRMSNDIEITLEANPGSVEADRFAGFRAAGVNRVSLGVQALNDDDLRRLGRLHSAREARAAVDLAATHFDRVSFDLICARQHQTLDGWTVELEEALGWGTDHMSIYQLTIEPGTAFGDLYRKGKLTGLPDEDLGADIYAATQELTAAHGLPAYEISNHARPGQESRHNMVYWQYGDYVGIGPGAHGRVTLDGQKHATETYRNPDGWLDAVARGGGTSLCEPVSPEAQAEEYAMMSLRTLRGLDLNRFAALGGTPMDPFRLKGLIDMGMVSERESVLRLTGAGRPVLNAVLAELLA